VKYIKRPEIVDALPWSGNNLAEIEKFINNPQIKINISGDGDIAFSFIDTFFVVTLGDYIIKSSTGDIYSCDQQTFRQSYERVEEQIVKKRKTIKG
jgi:phage-related protein